MYFEISVLSNKLSHTFYSYMYLIQKCLLQYYNEAEAFYV